MAWNGRSTMKTLAWGAVAGSVFAAAVALAPERAQACGGTFCDGGAPMPVDQSGENILFVIDEGFIDAHIQIQYTGDPAKFGWVIPLQRTPDRLAPGSEALFTNLLAGTVPQYGFQTTQDQCEFDANGMTGAMSTMGLPASGGEDGGAG